MKGAMKKALKKAKKGQGEWDSQVNKVSKDMFETIRMAEKVPERFRAFDTTPLELVIKEGMQNFNVKFPIK